MEELIITQPATLSELISDAVRKELEARAISRTPSDSKEVFTNRQAMDYLQVSRSTLQRWRNERKLPYRKVQGKILYTKADILKLLEEAQK
jgi:hypothetical protein